MMMAHGLVLSLHRSGHGHGAPVPSLGAGGAAVALTALGTIKAEQLDGTQQLEPNGTASGLHEQAFCTSCAALSSLEHAVAAALFAEHGGVRLNTSWFAPYAAPSRDSIALPFSRAPPLVS